MSHDSPFSPIEDLIADIRAGKMVLLTEDEDLENEGDLVCGAEFATGEIVSFMARFGRGLICVPITEDRAQTLGLSSIVQHNRVAQGTNFTVSVDAAVGITNGISPADRARTIALLACPSAAKEDLVQPGHVFPLIAREGGVLNRAGHTEAALDLAILAGLQPAAVICEVLNANGTMAKMPDLLKFSQEHGILLGTIEALVIHRLTL
jgi:3,4-dihydroxy 2-butanone 4-phosphate synthase/GTP cyclohydrolase II